MGRRSDDNSWSFLHKLAWTVFGSLAVSLVGLVVLHYVQTTGGPPLVSVSDASESTSAPPEERPGETTGSDKTTEGDEKTDGSDSEESFFSFHDQLADGAPDGATPPEASAPESADDSAATLTLQAGAHPSLESAKRQMQQLDRVGLEPWVVATEGPDGDDYYRVHVGKFASSEEARAFRDRLRDNRGIETHLAEI